MRVLMWFRADLRVTDNTALYHACKAANDGVLAVFTLCPKQWAQHDWGSTKVDFLLRNLAALSESLAKLNIPMLLVQAGSFASVPAKLVQIAKRQRCDALFFNREYEVNEVARDRAVLRRFEKEGIQVHEFTDQVILDVAEIRTGKGGWYTVYTPFRRKWCAVLEERGPPRIWPKPRRQAALGIKSDAIPSKLSGFTRGSRADLWPAGEKESAKRLRGFIRERIESYQENRDFPAVDGTSTLSPYLSAGVISPRQCMEGASRRTQCLPALASRVNISRERPHRGPRFELHNGVGPRPRVGCVRHLRPRRVCRPSRTRGRTRRCRRTFRGTSRISASRWPVGGAFRARTPA